MTGNPARSLVVGLSILVIQAPEARGQGEPEKGRARAIEEIIVTAQKKEVVPALNLPGR